LMHQEFGGGFQMRLGVRSAFLFLNKNTLGDTAVCVCVY